MNIFPEIPNDRLSYFKSNVKEWLDADEKIKGLEKQLKREPLPLPHLEISEKPFWELTFEDFTLQNYQHHPVIQFPVAI